MWTYKKPYTPKELTREYIEHRGQLALSRALNIGRVVGFIGSGATSGYGQPSWDDLVRTAIKEAKKLSENTHGTNDHAAKTARATLVADDLANSQTYALGLAEHLAFITNNDVEFRRRISSSFREIRPKEKNVHL